MDRNRFRKLAIKAVGEKRDVSDFRLSALLVGEGAPFESMSRHTVYNWLTGKSEVPFLAGVTASLSANMTKYDFEGSPPRPPGRRCAGTSPRCRPSAKPRSR